MHSVLGYVTGPMKVNQQVTVLRLLLIRYIDFDGSGQDVLEHDRLPREISVRQSFVRPDVVDHGRGKLIYSRWGRCLN